MTKKIVHKKDLIVFNFIAYFYLSVMAIICIVPFLLIVSGSITSEQSILRDGFSLIPKEISFEAYKMIFLAPDAMLRAYGITIFITFVGGSCSLFLTSMTAYVLQHKDFPFRSKFSFYFYFTTLFSGGLVPWYILMMKYLGLKNNILALIIPLLFNVFYIIIVRSFMSGIPDSISESAKMDGAGEFTIFLKLILPLSKPVLAAMGLFIALNYWNDWFNAMLFIDKSNMMPLQYYLHNLLASTEGLNKMRSQLPPGFIQTSSPSESLKMAMTVITIGPIILLYPYLQKYFVKGIMVGSVKG